MIIVSSRETGGFPKLEQVINRHCRRLGRLSSEQTFFYRDIALCNSVLALIGYSGCRRITLCSDASQVELTWVNVFETYNVMYKRMSAEFAGSITPIKVVPYLVLYSSAKRSPVGILLQEHLFLESKFCPIAGLAGFVSYG